MAVELYERRLDAARITKGTSSSIIYELVLTTALRTIPPGADVLEFGAGTASLLKMLPWTETLGELVNFYFTFVFSVPYESFIPLGGVETELPFPNGMKDARNRALVVFRNRLIEFINDYEPDNPQIYQWPLNIET